MKKKNMKVLSVCSLASLVISGSVISTTGVKAADTNTTTRLGGSDRYETAVKISQNGWKSGSDYVVLANGQGFADALCANPIAKSKNAPILLTESTSLNSSTLAELKRLNAKHVIIVGGTGVVPTAIENTIKTQLNTDVTRYGGSDRYETSVKIAKSLGNTSKIVLASGRDFADALSAAPAASIEGIPVVLTQPDQLPSTTSDYIKGNTNLTKTYVIGGTGSVSDALYNTLKNPERFGGIDRFETNAKVIDGFKDDFDFNNIYVALGKGSIGNEFADSLTGGALASKNKNALVITSSPISSYTTGILKNKLTTSSTLTILGGTGNITDTMISTLKDAITNSPSTGGGGGSSSSDIDNTAAAIDLLGGNAKVENKLKTSELSNYFTPTVSDGKITLTVKDDYKEKLATTSEIFDDIKANKDTYTVDQIKDKLDTANTIAENHVNSVLTGTKKTYKDAIAELKADPKFDNLKYGKYIKSDNTIDTEELATAIKNKTINSTDYAEFANAISDRISSSITDKDTSPTIEYETLEIGKITQGSTTIYDSSKSRVNNIKSILGINEDGTVKEYTSAGTYKLYYNGSSNYIAVTVVD
jgi:Putative cell wall-binding domain